MEPGNQVGGLTLPEVFCNRHYYIVCLNVGDEKHKHSRNKVALSISHRLLHCINYNKSSITAVTCNNLTVSLPVCTVFLHVAS